MYFFFFPFSAFLLPCADENCKPFSDEEAVVDDLTVIIRNIFANFSDMFTDYSKCILRTRCPKHLS